jgi:Rha family phage regulatory protein
MSEIIELTVTNGQPTTTSLAIAERFGKQHKNVLRDIENLDCSKEFTELNFEPTSRTVAGPNGGKRLEPMYQITKDGFMFLAMGFTGKGACV